MLVVASEEKRLERSDTEGIAGLLFSDDQRDKFRRTQEVDLAYGVPGLGRFRVNVFQQRGTVGLVLRVIPMHIKTIDELGLPPVLKRIALRRARTRAGDRHHGQAARARPSRR